MRWFWRTDPLPLILVGLLEGGLVGVGYVALAAISSKATPPLPLAAFWLAGAAGLAAARLRSPRLRLVFSAPAVILGAGVLGWLIDPAVRGAIQHSGDPLAGLSFHPAGWLLGLAAFRGAVHADTDRESDICVDALTYSFPVLGAALLVNFATGGPSTEPAVAGATACILAGLLAIGHARLREFESGAVVTGTPGVWPSIYTAILVVAVLALPLAFVIGTSSQGPIEATARLVGAVALTILGWLGSGLGWLASQFPAMQTQVGQPIATPHTILPVAPQTPPSSVQLPAWVNVLYVFALVFLLGAVALMVQWLVGRRRAELADDDAAAVREERSHDPLFGRLRRPHIALPSFRPRLPWNRQPTSAVEAYLALLDDLAGREDLARAPDETPRSHARRAGEEGLEPDPLALLAADYQLAIYGRVEITPPETARAIRRWERLRAIARRLPHET
jgi:Domain of unknown function (DUF4129)